MKGKLSFKAVWIIFAILVFFITPSFADSNRSIDLTGTDGYVMVGKQIKLTASVNVNSDDAPKKTSLMWESADTTIAKVTNGAVTGVSAGTTTIRASAKDDPSIYSEYSIEVRTPVKSIKIDPPKAQLIVGSTEDKATTKLKAIITPENAYYQNTTWSSSDESIIKIEDDGTVKALAKGTAKITAISKEPGSKAKAVATITVGQAVEKITLDQSTITLVSGKSIAIKSNVYPSNASNKKLEWVSNNESIASVNKNGQIKGINGGETTITAKATDGSGITANIVVKVIKPVLHVSIDSYRYDYGKSVKLNTTITNSDGSTEGLEKAFPGASIKAALQTDKGQRVQGFIEQGTDGLSFECNFPLSDDYMAPGNYKILVQSNVEKLKAYSSVFYYTADRSWLPPLNECSVELTLNYSTVRIYQDLIMTAKVTDKKGNPVPGIKVGFEVLTMNRRSTRFFRNYSYIWNTTDTDGECALKCGDIGKRIQAGKYIVRAFIVDAAGTSEKDFTFTGN